jgi:hypothetical protein
VILAQFLKPFEDWGVYGASTTSSRMTGDTDSTSFNQAGLAGIGTDQDPVEYDSTTWHTNLDTYERIVPDDAMKNAAISAAVVFDIANREKMMPRFATDDLAPLQSARGGGAGRGGATGPTAAPHVYAAAKNKPLERTAPGLLPMTTGASAIALPSPSSTATAASAPAHGKVAVRADGSFVYSPDRDFVGTDVFTYTLTVGGTTTSPASVTIVVK